MACPSEVLSDYFVKSQIVKGKFCQFDLQRLYCTSVVLSGKMFRIKTYFWLNYISVNLLCKPKFSQLAYSSLLKVLPSSATTSGCHIEGEQCSLLCRHGQATRGWESLVSSQHACTSWCAPVPARHVDCISLQSAWVESSLAAVIKIRLILLRINPSWLNLLSTKNSNIQNFN